MLREKESDRSVRLWTSLIPAVVCSSAKFHKFSCMLVLIIVLYYIILYVIRQHILCIYYTNTEGMLCKH